MTFELEIAARTLWMESRGESVVAQQAVACVLANRVKDGRWGKNLTTVCLWPYQFSSWNTTDGNRKAMAQLNDNDLVLSRLSSLLNGTDITNGATHYYADYIPEPAWVSGATFCGKFGKQLFYKDVK